MLSVVLRYRWRHLNPPWTAANLVWHAARHPTCPCQLQLSRLPDLLRKQDPDAPDGVMSMQAISMLQLPANGMSCVLPQHVYAKPAVQWFDSLSAG